MEKTILTGMMFVESKKQIQKEGKNPMFIINFVGMGFASSVFVDEEIFLNIKQGALHEVSFEVGSYENRLSLKKIVEISVA